MTCTRCESPLSETARYCETCGLAVAGDDMVQRLAQAHDEELAGRLVEAARQYEQLLKQVPGGTEYAVVRKHLGNLHFRMGHLRSAREHLARACELDEKNGACWHELGVIDYHMADFRNAITSFRRARSVDENLHLPLFWLGNSLYHIGDLEGAVEAFQQLIERFPNFSIARYHLGVIYTRQGNTKRAEAQFQKLLLDSPEHVAAQFYSSDMR